MARLRPALHLASRRTATALAWLTLVALPVAAAAGPVEVNTCGQVVEKDGFLAADLDCSTYGSAAIVLAARHARLDLRGFTLFAGNTPGTTVGVLCGQLCEIVSDPAGGKIIAATDVFTRGIYGVNRAIVRDVEIRNFEDAIYVHQVKASNVILADNSNLGIAADLVRIVGSTISGNAYGGVGAQTVGGMEPAKRVHVVDSVVTGNGESGVRSIRAVIRGSTVTANGHYGVKAVLPPLFDEPCKVLVRESDLSGNGVDADCGLTVTCADVASCDRPKVGAGTCQTSYVIGSGFPGQSWGVCSLD
jgi:hypothetical protein